MLSPAEMAILCADIQPSSRVLYSVVYFDEFNIFLVK